MALTVETGSGQSNANSYISVADADTYVSNHSNSTAWTAATSAVKEKALRLATQFLDTQYDGRWRGSRVNSTQALSWPRACVEDNDGFVLDSTSIPQKLKDACVEAALRVVEGDSLLAPLDNAGAVKSESVKVGPITTTTEYSGANPPSTQYPMIDGLIASLVYRAGRLIRG